MNSKLLILLVAVTILAGCSSTRSISNSGYHDDNHSYNRQANGSDPAFEYRGELSEFDVLGITRGDPATESDIQHALAQAKEVKLSRGSSILLIQSGAVFPDGPMVSELSKYFRVTPFSGVPTVYQRGQTTRTESADPENFSKSIRLAAARGGNEFVLCYWGALESASENLATKTVSWVPVVNWIVPDERQHMRIRLKLALVDVRTGNWSVVSTDPVDDSRINRSPKRGAADQRLVETLKNKAYVASVKELLKKQSDVAEVPSEQAEAAHHPTAKP